MLLVHSTSLSLCTPAPRDRPGLLAWRSKNRRLTHSRHVHQRHWNRGDYRNHRPGSRYYCAGRHHVGPARGEQLLSQIWVARTPRLGSSEYQESRTKRTCQTLISRSRLRNTPRNTAFGDIWICVSTLEGVIMGGWSPI